MPKITLFYDVISPWSLFAFELLKRYRKPWNLDIVLKPTYLGGVMVSSGNKPPITVKNKGIYMHNYDMVQTSKLIGVSYKYPEVFPVNTINIIRFLRIAEDKVPEKLEALTAIFFDAIWGQSAKATENINPKTFASFIPKDVLTQAQVEEFIQLSQTEENKDRVKKDASDIVAAGAFGFPWMQVKHDNGEQINVFGSDRFEVIAHFLGKPYYGPFPDKKSKL
ncbi:thioredoxin-like protein [Meredithblackwellia eburnea MCA 4105]